MSDGPPPRRRVVPDRSPTAPRSAIEAPPDRTEGPGSSNLVALRSATRSQHEQLDRRFQELGWLDDPDRFAAYLGAVAAAHHEVEVIVDAHPVTAQTGYQPKSHLVAEDLALLGAETSIEQTSRPLLSGAPFETPNVEADVVLGLLYVVEGSVLGGRHIASWVRSRFDGPRSGATRLLDPYGSATASRWRATTIAINERVSELDVAAGAAIAAFGLFGDHIDAAVAATA